MAQDAPPPENLPGAPEMPEETPPPVPDEKKEEPKTDSEGGLPDFLRKKDDSDDDESAEEESSREAVERSAKRDFFILVGLFVFVIVLYILHGIVAPNEEEKTAPKETETTQAENKAPTLTTGGGGFFSSLFGTNQIPLPFNTKVLSFYHGWVTLASGTAGSAIYPGREFVRVQIVKDNLSYIPISGWSLQNSKGDRFYLGNAARVPMRGQVNSEDPLIVNAGDTIIVSSGDSPIGVSFQQNSCSGYLEQFQDFFPPISDRCPNLNLNMDGLSRTCRSFVHDIAQCKTVVDFPPGISGQCKNFISAQTGYNACVQQYRDNPGFLGNIWRIYLKQDEDIWQQPHDTITLFDDKGKIVAAIKY